MAKLKSRKFWVAVIGSIVLLVNTTTGLELSVEQTLAVLLPLIAYILGESWVDARRV